MQNSQINFSIQRIFCSDIVQGEKISSDEDAFIRSQHPQREFLFVLRGESRFMLNRTICDLKPGDAVMIDKYVLHSSHYTELDHDLEHIWVWFYEDPPFYCNFIRVRAKGQFEMVRSLFLPEDLCRVIQYRWDLLQTFSSPSPQLLDEMMHGPFQVLLDELKLQMKYHFHSSKKTQLSDFLKNYIHHCLGRECSLKKLAEITGYSESHISHTFQEETGFTIGSYLIRVRMDYTKTALKKGKKQKEIASELGFASPVSFWIWYRKNVKTKNTLT